MYARQDQDVGVRTLCVEFSLPFGIALVSVAASIAPGRAWLWPIHANRDLIEP